MGSIWPDALSTINAEISLNEGNIVAEEELIRFVETNMASTANPMLLRSSFGLSDDDSEALGEQVLKYQISDCGNDPCSALFLPSLQTMVKQPCSESNLEASRIFLDIMRKRLNDLTMDEKKTVRTWKTIC